MRETKKLPPVLRLSFSLRCLYRRLPPLRLTPRAPSALQSAADRTERPFPARRSRFTAWQISTHTRSLRWPVISGPIQFGLTGWTARRGARLRKRWLPIVWRVVELTPEGYTVSITQEAGTFLVTNTLKQPPETPPVTPPVNPPGQKTLPQTGALWWPVPILAAAGLLLIAAGAGKKRKT